jgi:hypothetical protein
MVQIMAYLNQQEREELANALIDKTYLQAKRTVRNMDRQSKLGVMRNMQRSGELLTRYTLPNKGAIVSLIEQRTTGYHDGTPEERQRVNYELVRVVVEPTPDNRT